MLLCCIQCAYFTWLTQKFAAYHSRKLKSIHISFNKWRASTHPTVNGFSNRFFSLLFIPTETQRWNMSCHTQCPHHLVNTFWDVKMNTFGWFDFDSIGHSHSRNVKNEPNTLHDTKWNGRISKNIIKTAFQLEMKNRLLSIKK